MIEHLNKLATHLEGLDSASTDAKAIRWAVTEIAFLSGSLEIAREGLKDVAGRAHNRLARSEDLRGL